VTVSRSRSARGGSLLANVWCGSFSCGSWQSAVPESAIRWESAVPFGLGIDIACRAARQVSLADVPTDGTSVTGC